MKKKLILMTAVCALMLSCSDNSTSIEDVEKNDSGVISNEDITLTYGKSLLNGNVQVVNEKIAFNNFTTPRPLSRAMFATTQQSYNKPDLTNAKELTEWIDIQVGTTYYIPEGKTFSAGFNFNGAGTLVVLGTLKTSINVPQGGTVIVAPSGSIDNSINFHMNGGVLDNYGTVNYASGSLNGTINNYSELIFNNQQFALNATEINNYCGITFKGSVTLNAPLNNYSYVKFENGFTINSKGLNLGAGSLTEITGGQININTKVENTQSEFARVDITNANIQNLNATPAFGGKIDINTSLTFDERKLDNQVLVNANTYIAAEGCRPSRGLEPCNSATLQFSLTAKVDDLTHENTTLSATDVYVNNGKAYVSYHTNDSQFGDASVGAVRVFDIQNYSKPTQVSEALFHKMEVNGLYQTGNDLYLIGGNKAGARLVHTNLQNGEFNSTDLSSFSTYKIPGVAAKTIISSNDNLWFVSAGTEGGLFKSDKNNFTPSKISNLDGTRGKYLAQNKNVQAFLSVDDNGAHLRIANLDGSNPQEYTYSDLVQQVQTGKNSVTMDDNYAYLALSDKGVAKVELATGKLVGTFVPNDYIAEVGASKTFKNKGLTNSIAIAECYLLLANGADGVIVLKKDDLSLVGSFEVKGKGSANLVYVKDGLIFVATGTNNLNIIKMN